MSASIGITLYPEDASEADELPKNADQAMYAARGKGRNCYQYSTSSMQQRALSRALLVRDLRWEHPTRGLVSPAEFIPAAEETRMIIDIDYLKIDQSFVRNLEADSDDMARCEAIIVMAHKLGLKVVGEGIETEAQRELLTAAGCDYGQGYLFSKPVSAAELEKVLASDRVMCAANPDAAAGS